MKQRSTLLLLVVEVIQGSREAEKNESTCHGASRWLWACSTGLGETI